MNDDDDTLLSKVSLDGAAMIRVIIAERNADPSLFMSIKRAAVKLGLSESRVRELVASGELASTLDGHARRVSTAAVYARMIANVVESNPKNAPAKRANGFRGERPKEKKEREKREKEMGGKRPNE
jgi:excisionase family DNA binding protein